MIARGLNAILLAFGALLLALMCLAWAIVAVVLLPLATVGWGRRVGRIGAMYCFRTWLATMEALGAWRLDLSELASPAAQVSHSPVVESATHIRG